jgi:type III restriction enzyme
MKTIKFQQEYIQEIVNTSVKFLNDEYREQSTIVFKAPTGSGKTYMISQALTKIVKEQRGNASYSFIWLSVNSLHEQSRESLTHYLEDERLLECITIDDIQNSTLEENEIVFINWDSLIKQNNVFRMDNEQNWNLQSVIENTADEGREVILIIDESHRTAKAEKAKEVIEEIKPRLIIEMTATPLKSSGSLIEIPLRRVIAEGMIKSELLINPSSKNIKENKDLLEVALKKRKELKRIYNDNGIEINPLLLIQIPNKKQTDSTNPEDYIVGLLADYNITESNGKLAIRLSGVDIKELDEKIKPNTSEIDVLIFKEAIALGWDCPRASLLFLQREWKQERYSFNVQTLGRIMRMPEQKHYESSPELNVGYVYSASDNFEIVQELANDYVSNLQMERDEEINTKPIKLRSEFIRRKRELTRLSGDFKKCLFEVAKKQEIINNINTDIKNNLKTIALNGKVTEIDIEDKQVIEFDKTKSIKKDRKEIADSYVNFCAKMSTPYAKARSTNIIKSAIRALFKENLDIGDEDDISAIVMNRINNPQFRRLLEEAKENYANLPKKDEEVVPNENWEIPKTINIFTDYEIFENSNKSIIKESEEQKLYIKKNKNGKIELSKPEIKFIDELDKTDDDVLWWFKNGAKESKYFGIAYKKKDNHIYGFYPDFIIKTKKETLIVEIKDDKDFKPENALKLHAGRDYVARAKNSEIVRFYMTSPIDYDLFFTLLKDQEIEKFSSLYEERLLRYNQSQKKLIENKTEQSEKDKEELELLSELDSTISELENEKLKNELLEMQLADAQENIQTLSKTLATKSIQQVEKENINIKLPFNICVLGEVSAIAQIRKELNDYFEKIGITTTDWNIEFFNNKKLQNSSVLRSLHKGQSKFSIIVTGQIFHHSGKGNTKANIISELENEKYIPHCIGSNPKDLLTPAKMTQTLNNYLRKNCL